MRLPQSVPILTAFTARVAGCGLEELLRSPNTLARALADTQTVVGHDGVLCLFEPSLLSYTCTGKQGDANSSTDRPGAGLTPANEVTRTAPLTAILESIQPLRHHLPDSAMIYATFTGPGLLFTQLQEACDPGVVSEYVVEVVLGAVRASLDLKVDGIVLIEQSGPEMAPDLMRCHRKVRKLADFYDAGFIVFNLPGAEEQQPGFPAHCMFNLAFGRTGPGGPIAGLPEQSDVSRAVPFTTAGDVPESTPVEDLKKWMREVQAA